MTRYDFLIDTYRTERLKTLSLWSQVPEERMSDRLEVRARSPREQMVHQCLSEDTWMRNMLGISVDYPALPAEEVRSAFIERYAEASAARLVRLDEQDDAWFEGQTTFFDVSRSRAWVLTRRLTHSAHHRAQLQTCLRAWGVSLYSNYGPTADTGGLAANGGRVIYRYPSVEALLDAGTVSTFAKATADESRLPAYEPEPLPGPGEKPTTERPD